MPLVTGTPHPRTLAAAGLVFTALALTGCTFSHGVSIQHNSITSSDSSSSGDDDTGDAHTDHASYSIQQPVGQLSLNNPAGSVTVTAADGPITVSETAKYTDDKPGTSHTVSGGTLVLTNSGCPEERVVNGRCEVDWEIRAPAGTNLDLESDAGEITVTGMSGSIRARADSGGVSGRGLTSKSVTAKSDAGGVHLAFTQPPDQAKASSDAGGIHIELPSGTSYAVAAHSDTDNPKIDVAQDSGSPHRIQAKSDAGSIKIKNG
jgi:hypothetical protein